MDKKGSLIEKILKLTKREPEIFFDKLSDKSEIYLEKLLKVAKALK